MGGKKGKKNANSNGEQSPTIVDPPSPSPPSPTISKQEKKAGKEKQSKVNNDDLHVSGDYHMHTGKNSDKVVVFLVLLLSIYVVSRCPAPEIDVNKQPNISYLNLYLGGFVDHIPYISQMLIAGFLSVFMDIFVVSYHVLYPPHPKFVLSFKRKVSIYVHLISGITEITCGVLAFVITDTDTAVMFSKITSIASITHGLTAFYQTGIVFGAKGVMVPGYTYAITLHVTNALRLFRNPASMVNLLQTFLLLHIYVWCRFFIYFFRVCHMFNNYHYTVSITLSGLLLFPFAVGPAGNFGFLLVVISYCVLQALISQKRGKALSDKLFREHERYALITHEQLHDWHTELNKSTDELADPDRAAARAVFDKLHSDHHKEMHASEIHRMLLKLQVPNITCRNILAIADSNKDGSLSFEEFYRHIWHLGSVHKRLKKLDAVTGPANLSQKEKARLIFDMLDLDNSGYVGLAEIELLLSQWGMPHDECSIFLQSFKSDHKVGFDEFFTHMQPIWDFAATQIYE